MCGICGIAAIGGVGDGDEAAVRRMTRALVHRGPDDEGFYRDGSVVMAMRRLSIIDLRGASQPLFNEDRTLVLMVNGEIYNYRELREELAARGHRLATQGDCETILHLYEERGPDCVHQLRGMFAFALWDMRERRLLLGRDRMGEKPLYTARAGNRLLFSSEMKSLLRSGLVPFELDPGALNLFFHYDFVPEPRTPVRGVRKLDAAHVLTLDVGAGKESDRCYWRLSDAPVLDGSRAEEALRAELDTVMRIVLRADVPVGVALSGGLDSSAVAALAAQKYSGNIHAFTVGYEGRPQNDERADARWLADRLGLPFHEVAVSTAEMVAAFPGLVERRDDPIADVAGHGYEVVAQLAREHGVPVLLQGQGGDELFWGYPEVREALRETMLKEHVRRRSWRALPACLRLEKPAGRAPWQIRKWLRDLAGLRTGWRKYRDYRWNHPGRMIFYDRTVHFRAAQKIADTLFTRDCGALARQTSPFAPFTLDEPWPRADICMTALICDTYLRENGLAQGDRLTMAHSVEMRLPLVDHRLVETVIGLRKDSPDHGQPPKARLLAVLADALPPEVRNRPKRGFTPPVRDWYTAVIRRYGEDLADGYLTQNGILEPGVCRLLVEESAYEDWCTLAFGAIVLETWCRRMCSLHHV